MSDGSMSPAALRPAVLRDVLVVEGASMIAGPLCTALLQSFGARVIKVELPGEGDTIRKMGPASAPETYWSFLSQGKECVTCRFSTSEGADMLKRMLEAADVFIESFRPGTLEKWGLGSEDLAKINPELIVIRISGFGQDGPYKERPGYGTLAEAMSGLAHVTGDPNGAPMLPGFPVGDTMTGLMAAVSVLAALMDRREEAGVAGGERLGSLVELSIFETMAYLMNPTLIEAQATGKAPVRLGNRGTGGRPRNAVICSDGKWVAYSVQSPKLVRRLVEFLGMPELERLDDAYLGPSGVDLDRRLAAWVAEHDRDFVMDQLEAADIPAAPINDAFDVLHDRNLNVRGDLVPLADPIHGSIRVMAPPMRFDHKLLAVAPAPAHPGQDNVAVYAELLGLSSEEVAALAERGVI